MMTAGGPRINGDAQLVREDGTVVGGAYLAGEIRSEERRVGKECRL